MTEKEEKESIKSVDYPSVSVVPKTYKKNVRWYKNKTDGGGGVVSWCSSEAIIKFTTNIK